MTQGGIPLGKPPKTSFFCVKLITQNALGQRTVTFQPGLKWDFLVIKLKEVSRLELVRRALIVLRLSFIVLLLGQWVGIDYKGGNCGGVTHTNKQNHLTSVTLVITGVTSKGCH